MYRLMMTLFIIFISNCTTTAISADKDELLYQAARKGDPYRVQELINQGADVNYKKQFLSHDEYPLNGAIKSGKIEIVMVLIANGAKIDTENDDRNILSDAIYHKHKNIMHYLISKGNYVERSCKSQLIFTAIYSRSIEMLKFVVQDLGVCIDSKQLHYETTPLFETICEELYQYAYYLIKKGADLNAQNKKKETPLHCAVSSSKIKMIELLLKNGADVHIKDEKGLSPLDYANKENNPRVLALLKRYGT